MSEREETVAILFADICGSTALFEETGNQKALGLIGRTIDSLANIARVCGGNLIRSKGDDVLCTFDDVGAALQAASDMVKAHRGAEARIHVGIHHGTVIKARGDIFGDAVNIAARMLDLANAGEILVSEDFTQMLSDEEQNTMRLLEQRAVKGKSSPMNIYSVVTADPDATVFVLDGGEHTIRRSGGDFEKFPRARVRLIYHGNEVERTQDDPEFLIGRSAHCDLVINEPCVSREHVGIVIRRGKVTVTDRSSTGTYAARVGERAVFLRRESLVLMGTGVLSFGRKPKADNPNLLEFSQSIEA